jgi:hypothetical protein
MTDSKGHPLQRLPNPLALQEGGTSDLLARDKLAPAGVEVVLGDRSFQGFQSLPAFRDRRQTLAAGCWHVWGDRRCCSWPRRFR